MLQKQYVKLAFGSIAVIIVGWALFVFYDYYLGYEKQMREHVMSRHLLEGAVSVADFVHEVQKERGLSAAYLGAKSQTEKNNTVTRVLNQRAAVDRAWLDTKKRLTNDLSSDFLTPSMRQEIYTSMAIVDKLQNIRERVDSRTIFLQEELDYFSMLNDSFLNLVPMAGRITPTREVSQGLQIYWIILKWKEKVGIERGVIANILTSRHISEALFERAVAIHAVVAGNQKQVALLLDDKWHDGFNMLTKDPSFNLTNRYYEEVIHGIFSIDAMEWFDAMTRKIDRFDSFIYDYRTAITKNLDQIESDLFGRLIIFTTGTFVFVLFLLSTTFILSRKTVNMITDMQIASVVFDAHEGVTITDPNGVILRVNKAFELITGYSADEVIGKTPSILKSGRQDELFYQKMWNDAVHNGYWSGEVVNRRKDGSLITEILSITAIYSHQGPVTHFVGIFSDISKQKEAQETIFKLAFYDPLTNLPNRRLLVDRLEHAIGRCSRHGEYVGVAFIDLDHFKRINDTKGHDAGDELLIQTAERLEKAVRDTDTVARLGGDEFVVVYEGIGFTQEEAIHHATMISEKLFESLNLPYVIDGEQLYITGSIGIALVNKHDVKVDEILAQADAAMYGAKGAGRNGYRFFDATLQGVMSKQLSMEAALRDAIRERQFALLYQPQMDERGKLVGVEALIRWNHPERGIISPAEFIPMAEESRLIIDIGQWVVREGCKTLKSWQKIPRLSNVVLSVNIAAPHFIDKGFIELLRGAVEEYGIEPRMLRIELTESVFAGDVAVVRRVMDEIHALGMSLALDDFGTGYSSLSYLREFPFDEIKIDQSFVRMMTESTGVNYAISKAIVAMGDALGIDVIAEGVETQSQFEWLREMGCRHYQGYYFAKPLAKNIIEEMAEGFGI